MNLDLNDAKKLDRIQDAVSEALDDCIARLGAEAVVGAVLVWLVDRLLCAGWRDRDVIRIAYQTCTDWFWLHKGRAS